jgi:hypothetical protein
MSDIPRGSPIRRIFGENLRGDFMPIRQSAPCGNWFGVAPRAASPVRVRFPVAKSLLCFAFAAALGCSRAAPTAPPAQPDRHAEAIERALEQDRLAGDEFKRAVKANRLAATRDYLQAVAKIDLRPCPPDFQEAFLKHRYAWEELPSHLEKYAGLSGDLLSMMEFGEAVITKGSITTEGEREFERIRKGIRESYFHVERTALRYGVQARH